MKTGEDDLIAAAAGKESNCTNFHIALEDELHWQLFFRTPTSERSVRAKGLNGGQCWVGKFHPETEQKFKCFCFYSFLSSDER